jgi:hypothetical protein
MTGNGASSGRRCGTEVDPNVEQWREIGRRVLPGGLRNRQAYEQYWERRKTLAEIPAPRGTAGIPTDEAGPSSDDGETI